MRKNILHIVNSQTTEGGIGTVLNYLDRSLNENEIYQSIILKTSSGELGEGGYEQIEVNGEKKGFIYEQDSLKQELSTYDVIHIHGVPSYRILEAIESLIDEGYNPKIVNTCHSSVKKEFEAYSEVNEDNGYKEYWDSAIYRQERVMTLADKVQHMNYSYLNEIVEEYSAQENKYKHSVVYNGIKIKPDSEITEKPKKKRILYSGRFAAEKGIEELIESLPHIFEEHPDAEITFMGGDKEGEVTDFYQEIAERLIWETFGEDADYYLDRIYFTGWLTDKEHIEDLYDWCDFLIAPSKDESFCLAVAEALNHQRIPIMTKTPSLNELYLSNGVGIGIDPKNRTGKGIAAVVNKAFSEVKSPEMEANAIRGRKLVTEKYSLEEVMNQQIRLYEELLQ